MTLLYLSPNFGKFQAKRNPQAQDKQTFEEE